MMSCWSTKALKRCHRFHAKLHLTITLRVPSWHPTGFLLRWWACTRKDQYAPWQGAMKLKRDEKERLVASWMFFESLWIHCEKTSSWVFFNNNFWITWISWILRFMDLISLYYFPFYRFVPKDMFFAYGYHGIQVLVKLLPKKEVPLLNERLFLNHQLEKSGFQSSSQTAVSIDFQGSYYFNPWTISYHKVHIPGKELWSKHFSNLDNYAEQTLPLLTRRPLSVCCSQRGRRNKPPLPGRPFQCFIAPEGTRLVFFVAISSWHDVLSKSRLRFQPVDSFSEGTFCISEVTWAFSGSVGGCGHHFSQRCGA